MQTKGWMVIAMTLFLFALYSCRATKSRPGIIKETEGYTLLWADEFNTNGPPDSNNWRFEKGFVRNGELQWYQTGNAWCEKGLLVIEGRRELRPNPNYLAGSSDWKKKRENIEYTSSSINTSGMHAWKYGRFVMRGRIDVSAGLWPAWWTLGTTGRWPSNGEIDIMEYYSKKLLFNIALKGNSGAITGQ